ncbi:sugar transferase [Massilibacterium senegalense]|uniref:sugar transferase n=1 Tax=Massilibacterium senegalense TaxID=1632858 RepID=UPI000785D655|nr:exopolysaccharide biosynthesis polyprenyl glycosylphosphotransferase [Massilibacterium senegalense]
MKTTNLFQTYTSTNYHTYEVELNRTIYDYTKRILDVFLSLVGLIITFPIVIVFVMLIKLESPGPAFFIQERVGKDGRYFNLIKLRSMVIDAEKNGAQWAKKNDSRITKVGFFIRKTRIDELPQLINVLKGDMSLVGPRPERPVFTAQFDEEIPGFVNRLLVKPGLTGWAQVNGGYDITPEEKYKLDMYYIKNRGFIMDFLICLKTIVIVFTGNGAR